MRRKFRIDQILRDRKSIEDMKRSALAAIEEKQYREKEKLSRLREAQYSILNVEEESLGGSDQQPARKMTPQQLSCLDAFAQESFSRKKTILELQDEEFKAKEELIEASKSRKTMEKLRDREIQRERKRIMLQERKLLDEIAADRYIRTDSQS